MAMVGYREEVEARAEHFLRVAGAHGAERDSYLAIHLSAGHVEAGARWVLRHHRDDRALVGAAETYLGALAALGARLAAGDPATVEEMTEDN